MPGMSVMAFRGPGDPWKWMPRSRARAFAMVCSSPELLRPKYECLPDSIMKLPGFWQANLVQRGFPLPQWVRLALTRVKVLSSMSGPISPGKAIPLSEGEPRSGNAFAALRHRNFQLYFAGQLVSNAGTWMQVIAQGWLVYQLGHSELTLGLVSFASAIPSLLTLPWGGVVVDRMPKRTLLIITQSGAMLLAFILAFLSFTGLVQQWHIVALAAGLGLVNSFDSPGRQ